MVRWCWVSFQCRDVLLILMTVGHGPAALAVCTGGCCLDSFCLVYHFFFFFFLPLIWRRSDIDRNTASKDRLTREKERDREKKDVTFKLTKLLSVLCDLINTPLQQ